MLLSFYAVYFRRRYPTSRGSGVEDPRIVLRRFEIMNVLAEELSRYYEEIKPYDFYREIFGDGELDTEDSFTKGKYCGIAMEITDKKKSVTKIDKHGNKVTKQKPIVYRYNVTDDLDVVDQLQHSPHFCIMAPISYAGKSRLSKNARMMYALVIEIDNLQTREREDGTVRYLGLEELMNLYSDRVHYLPKPTYIVASGSGIHLYYRFEKPLVLFPNTVTSLKEYKKEMTTLMWNKSVTTTYKPDEIQYESIFQPFRMPGTRTKKGDTAVAFRVGEFVSIDYMNSFMPKNSKGENNIEGTYKSDLLLQDAKELYPDWYEKVIVNGDRSVKPWALNRAVYDWWLQEIKDQAVVGHRYYCLMMLAIYAIKCGNYDEKKNPNPVTYEEFETDAWELLKLFDELTTDENNRFTEHDVLCALQVYEDQDLITYPRNSIAYKSGIEIEPSIPRREKGKRLKQTEHLEEARMIRDLRMKRQGRKWTDGNGRPKGSGTAEQKVAKYRAEHPEESVTAVAKALNLSRTTVYKWWDSKPEPQYVYGEYYRYVPGGVEKVKFGDDLSSEELAARKEQQRYVAELAKKAAQKHK